MPQGRWAHQVSEDEPKGKHCVVHSALWVSLLRTLAMVHTSYAKPSPQQLKPLPSTMFRISKLLALVCLIRRCQTSKGSALNTLFLSLAFNFSEKEYNRLLSLSRFNTENR